ncbi:MAG: urease subunit alpha [Chloroflexi bacterium]|nr:urease subunit alpha [Chloroflexota bacterium]
MPREIDRQLYASLYGPTTGDRVRLADTNLLAEVEHDYTSYGDELLVGFGKSIREGMLATGRAGNDSKLDMLVANAVVMDPVLGIFKGNIGIKEGRIVGIGRAGNPDVVDDVDLVVGTNTSIVTAEGLIATPGGIDPHVHLASTSLHSAALSSGLTTLVGMGSGGVWDVGVNPAYNFDRLLEAFEGIPLNVALLGRGSAVHRSALERTVAIGCAGLKIHEDVGAYPAVIDACLGVADELGVAVALHTDSLNESAQIQETVAAIGGRTIHAYHVEGAGGGHPDLLELVSHGHILTSSTTPTIPYTVSTAPEHFDMIMVVHRMSYRLEEDRRATEARVRAATIAAESVLHDQGAIAMMSSDSQGMGRIGEVIRRTWQLAHRMKEVFGAEGPNDNARILRYLAKYTLNPAVTHGLANEIGSLEPGKLADVVLWRPEFFGVKPQLVLKSGFVSWAPVGDGNGSTRICEPQIYRPMYGGLGAAPASLNVNFVSQLGLDSGLAKRLGTRRRLVSVGPTRQLTKGDMRHNSACPTVAVASDGSAVTIDGRPVELEPATSLPLSQLYFLR